jgi:TadE-like protein
MRDIRQLSVSLFVLLAGQPAQQSICAFAGASGNATGNAMTLNLRFRSFRRAFRSLRGESAAQIAEFALSLPLLVIFVIGIYDFSSAVTLKHKLTNAVREGARVAAADPASDVAALASSGAGMIPASVSDAFQAVDTYLRSENVNDCLLSTARPQFYTGLTWRSTTPSCPGSTLGIVLTINRGDIPPSSQLVATQIIIQYPYQWQYGKAASLIGATFTGPTTIMTTAIAYNEN